MMKLRLIGDVHGAFDEYLNLIKDVDYSVQLGDLGRECKYIIDQNLDHTRHRLLTGNHDDLDPNSPNYFKKHKIFLDDFGTLTIPQAPPIFYLRGAWSIDHIRRKKEQGYPYNNKPPITWWEDEQLSADQFDQAIELYTQTKPEILLSHEGPYEIVKFVTDPMFAHKFGYQGAIETRTNQALQTMLNIHRPRIHATGHYHFYFDQKINNTQFICLDMIRHKDYRQCYIDLVY